MPRMSGSKEILMIVGDFVEDLEVMVPYQILLMQGHKVSAVSPGKRSKDKVKTAIHDFEGDQTYTEKRGHDFLLNADFEKIDLNKMDALVLPGGRAPEFLRLNPKVLAMVKHFFQQNKPVAAICHGLQILTAAKVLEGYSVTAYPTVQPEIESAGATFVEVSAGFDNSHVCRNLVSAPAWPAHPAFMKDFLALLETK